MGEHGEARPWLSRASVAVGLAIGLVAAAGVVLVLLAPAPPGREALFRLASPLLLISPFDLHPEPQETSVFGGLVLLSPILTAAAAWATVRLILPGRGRLDALAAAGTLLLAVAIVALDPAGARFRVAPLLFVGLVAAAAGLAVVDRRVEGRRRWVALATAVAFTVCALMMLAVSWRDARSLQAPTVPFEAFAYSVVASDRGRVCLVDLPTQYGCYGALLGPALRVVGTTVSHITLACVALSIAALAGVSLFAARTMRSPILAVGVVLALAVGTLRLAEDVYFQYLPLRVLFPALSLPAILWWDAGPGRLRAAALGGWAALAVFWNVDAGVPVLGSLGLYVVAASASGAGGLWRRVELGAMYGAAAVLGSALLLGGLAIAGHRAPDLASVVDYHRIFVASGLAMMPMPAPPAAWIVPVGLAASAIAIFALRLWEGTPSRPADHAAFLAVLGIGLFVYYVGRSHPDVLVVVAWPFLILTFVLLDRARPPPRSAAIVLRAAGGVLVLLLAVTALRVAPTLRKPPGAGPDPTAEDIAFVRDHTPPGAPLALLASKQAVILGELGRASALPGPGYAELLTQRDADALFDWLVASGPRDLFVSDDLIWRTHDLTGLSYWPAARLPRLNAVYDVVDRGPGGRLLHFVRKANGASVVRARGM